MRPKYDTVLLHINFNIRSIITGFETSEQLDKLYQSVYRPLIKLLNTNQKFSFSFYFCGNQLQFLKKRRKEFITLSRQLIDHKQMEIIGGGYYQPVLPLIYPIDRNAQIEKLNTEIRQTFGKRPRGIFLSADCWDPSLLNTLQTCGIEYIFLEDSLIPENKQKYVPIIMSDLGKTLEILPYYKELVPDSSVSPQAFIELLQSKIKKVAHNNNFTLLDPDLLISITFDQYKLAELLEAKWFEKLLAYVEENQIEDIKFTIPGIYRKNNFVKIPAYINSGIDATASSLIRTSKKCSCKKENYSVYDFLDTFTASKNLNNRIMYISMLVNQYKVDKLRKNEAKEKLWEAENCTSLLYTAECADFNSFYRQKSYKLLTEAEKILRQDNNFTESISNFDYNADGLNEYVCRMQNYFCYISLVSGAIRELEIIKNTGNYADNLSRIKEFDGFEDNYERAIFVDHALTEEQFSKYINNEPCGSGIFSKIQYTELKLNQKSHEISLEARALFSETKQKIYLRKKYLINSSGMMVQYVLRNESNKPLKFVFAVESNFAHTNFNLEEISYFNLETVENDSVRIFDTSIGSELQKRENELQNIDVIRLTDGENGISFCFEPNENCGYYYQPLFFKRPDKNGNLKSAALSFVSTLFWKIDLEPGRETEKTINFTITAVKKQKNITNK